MYPNNDNWQPVRYFQDLSLNSDFSGVSVPIHSMDCGSVQISWTGSTSSSGKFIVEASLNNEDWCAVYPESAVKRTSTGIGCVMYTIETISWPYIRVRYVRGLFSNNGLVQAYLFFKRRRANNP